MTTEAVKVMVRCRPINKRQKELNCEIVVNVDSKQNQINLFKPGSKEDPKPFTFDRVFASDSLQSVIYQETAFSLVDSVIEGYNGTIFAYGQTGCGKTHTMMGSNDNQSTKGIIPRTFSQIITFTNSESEKKHLVQCSFIEIYNQQIHDLLGKDTKARMDLKQSPNKGVFVKDLTMNIVKTATQMEHFMNIGFKNRATRQTAMNKQSSRSHSLFTIHIQSEQLDELGKEKFKAGKLNLVDLAGSERQSKTHAVGDGMKEAAKINLSLSALGNVISALVDGKTQHIPYRDSKLTRLLQDSLGGNTKTIMIAAISPASDNYEQTLSTLRYASRAKYIQNKPIINEDPKDTLLKQYAEQIKLLKLMLEGKMPFQSNMMSPAVGETQIKYIQVESKSDGNFQNQLDSKQKIIRNQQEEKQKLRQQLESLQNLISHDKENNQNQNKQLERMKKLKQKLRSQKKKEEEWRQEKKKREQEMMSMQKSYKSLNQEVEEMRAKFQQIKRKYIANMQQINDIRQQAERQKQELLQTIRFQESEINKYSGICTMILSQQQIQLIIAQSELNQETRQWIIAPFYYRDRNVNFPKLGTNKSNQLIEFERQKKELVFREMTRKEQISKIKASYRISDVVKGAREHNEHDLSNSSNNLNIPSQKKIKNPTGGLPQSQKNMQTLTPLRIEPETRYRMQQQPYSAGNISVGNGNKNNVKLNPINSKRNDHDWFNT